MPSTLQWIGRGLTGLVPEDRPAFKRIDASPVWYDSGAWLKPRR